MRLAQALVSAWALAAQAAPALSQSSTVSGVDSLSAYFDAIAENVRAATDMIGESAVCDLSRAQMPADADNLPAPAAGLTVRHVAVGRGTQNYTCDGSGTAPKAAEALATLFNVSCMAVLNSDLLERIPGMAVRLDNGGAERLGPSLLVQSGVHYFTDSATAFFDLDTPTWDLGKAPCAKENSVDAPPTAATGPMGEKAVTWLRLRTKYGATGGIKEVYRVTTAGGSPPESCESMPAIFEVPYAAVYWFWQGEDARQAREEGRAGEPPRKEYEDEHKRSWAGDQEW